MSKEYKISWVKNTFLTAPNDPKLRPVEETEKVVFGSLTRPKTIDGLACVASVSNRVIARSCPSFLDEPREETLATQAIDG